MRDWREKLGEYLIDKPASEDLHKTRIVSPQQKKFIMLMHLLSKSVDSEVAKIMLEGESAASISMEGEGRKEAVELGRSVPAERKVYSGLYAESVEEREEIGEEAE